MKVGWTTLVVAGLLGCWVANGAPATKQLSNPATTAEASDYKSTSRYDDVIQFIRAIQARDPDVRVENFATTTEGRALPLVLVGAGR